MSTVIYIISISLQLAGALLVLFFAVSTKRQAVIKSFAGASGIISRDNDTMQIQYSHDSFKETYRTAYLSKCAFVFIALGYFLGVFGSIEWKYKIVVGIMIILLTAIIMCITYWSVDYLVKHSDRVNEEITNEELEQLGIEPDMENVSVEDIEGFFS